MGADRPALLPSLSSTMVFHSTTSTSRSEAGCGISGYIWPRPIGYPENGRQARKLTASWDEDQIWKQRPFRALFEPKIPEIPIERSLPEVTRQHNSHIFWEDKNTVPLR
jgi:hypothetical protein